MRVQLALILAITASSAAAAQPAPGQELAPLGVGLDTCKSWLAHHGSGKPEDRMTGLYDQWLYGYVTGYNSFADPKARGTTFFRFDMPNLPEVVSIECHKRPDLYVFEAVNLFLKLQKRLHDKAKSRSCGSRGRRC